MAKEFRYLFFDTEMSGYGQLVSIGYIITDADANVVDERYYVIKPKRPISERSTAIHGITTEMAQKEGITLNKALMRFDRACKICNVVVGYAVSNDLLGVSLAYTSLNKMPTLISRSLTVVDVAPMAEDYLATRGIAKRGQFPSLEHTHEALFGQTFNAHNALDDARATMRCFWHMMSDTRQCYRSIIPMWKLLRVFRCQDTISRLKQNAAPSPNDVIRANDPKSP